MGTQFDNVRSKIMTFFYDEKALSEIIGEVLLTAIAVLAFSVIAVFVFSYMESEDVVHADIDGWVDVSSSTVYLRHSGGETIDLNKVELVLNLNGTRRDLSSSQLEERLGSGSWHLGQTIDIDTDDLWNTTINEDDYVGMILIQTNANAVIESGSLHGEEVEIDSGSGSGGNVTPQQQNPVADFIYLPSSPNTSETVTFTDQSTDADGTVVGWSWSFGDGGTSSTQNPSYQYSSAGTYTITLNVTDDDGNTGSTSQTVTVTVSTVTPETTSPVSLWTFDIRSDSIVVDSADGNDGAIIRATRVSSDVNNSAIKFEQGPGAGSGNKQYVTVPDSSNLDITTEGSVESWIYLEEYSDFSGIVHKGQSSAFSDESYSLQFGGGVYGNNEQILFSLNNGQFTVLSSSQLSLDTWYHVVGTWNSTSINVYIDGILDNTNTGTNIAANPSTGSLQMGAQLTDGTYGFNGMLDEVAIYDYALNATEVQQRYDLYA
ncbi:LamG-like jellyroll fold domain-containing protein [Methanolobus vulcani]|uniref:Type IV pilin n=1 Tax=Methanolobus vulcani TaxID=38026 RepID=A0A7Z8KRL1_9EURY|nr:LamG-like jellyroll fold domain-containing protein [Methanolobus vulcani]TQD26118.1 type IV pilin [Methanolobus vulcani]